MTGLIYAPLTPGDNTTMRAWESRDQHFEETGGTGDELEYDPAADRFSYYPPYGATAEAITAANPVPGDPLTGAQRLSDQLDAEYA